MGVLDLGRGESGVTIEGPPARKGCGSEGIERCLPYMLGGAAGIEFDADGLECTIQVPLAEDRKADS